VTVARSWLACSVCGHQVPLEAFGGCNPCAAAGRIGVLEVAYRAIADRDASVLQADGRPGVWRWHGLLPVLEGSRTLISLGEGQTPLLLADQPVTPADGPAVWLKYEGKNPTHSFKDRFQSVAISAAAALGVTRIVCQSTGNHGVAAAAYAARAGLQCVVLTHEEVPNAHVEAIRQFGAMPVAVPPAERSRLLHQLVDSGWYPATTHWPFPVSNPYGIEGYKTIAFEIAEQLGADQAGAAHVFVPVGGGDSIYGIYKGWRELVQLGALDRLPKLYACQPEDAAPLVAAEVQNATEVPRVETQRSPALSIREAETGGHALRALRDSGGHALAVADTEIMDAASRLGRVGLSVDPASAASVAGALAMLESGKLDDGGPIVCILTASGARWPQPQGWQPSGPQVAVLSADQAYKAIVALTQ
jgi:threonine synthase